MLTILFFCEVRLLDLCELNYVRRLIGFFIEMFVTKIAWVLKTKLISLIKLLLFYDCFTYVVDVESKIIVKKRICQRCDKFCKRKVSVIEHTS